MYLNINVQRTPLKRKNNLNFTRGKQQQLFWMSNMCYFGRFVFDHGQTYYISMHDNEAQNESKRALGAEPPIESSTVINALTLLTGMLSAFTDVDDLFTSVFIF